MLKLIAALLVGGSLLACGASPMQPAPQPLPEPVLAAIPQPLDLGDLQATGWPYEGLARNTGQGCAARVRGVVTLRVLTTVQQTIAWALEPGRVIRAGETFRYGGCCVDRILADQDLQYSVTFQWETVAC